VRPAKSLTWIHLSDLHFGQGREATPRFDQKLVTSAIVRDAEMVAGQLGKPDLVFVTGDVAFSASADKEYQAAADWLGKLLAALQIGPAQVSWCRETTTSIERRPATVGAGSRTRRSARTPGR